MIDRHWVVEVGEIDPPTVGEAVEDRKQADDSYALEFTFVIEPGESRRPKAPITEKVAAV